METPFTGVELAESIWVTFVDHIVNRHRNRLFNGKKQ
ncbi:unnamed protein product, partial [Ectocarpus sp. 4 AP-2014]